MTRRRYDNCPDTRLEETSRRGEYNTKGRTGWMRMLRRCLDKVDLILDEVESTVQGILLGLYTVRPRG